MLGLEVDDLAGPPLWVDTGAEQLVIPLRTFAAVRRAAPRAEALLRDASNGQRAMAYLFAREDDRVLARFFFPKHGSVIEDPGTGSACANLGGWLLATGADAAAAARDRPGRGRRAALPAGTRSDRRPPHPRIGTGHRNRTRHHRTLIGACTRLPTAPDRGAHPADSDPSARLDVRATGVATAKSAKRPPTPP